MPTLARWAQLLRENNMRKLVLGALAALFAFVGSAQNIKPSISLKLYPEGQTVDKGIVENGVSVTLGPCDDNEDPEAP